MYTKTSMGPDLDGFGVSHKGLDKPTCHPDMSELHADISSAAAEIFAASVALSELLHLGYVTSELGLAYTASLVLPGRAPCSGVQLPKIPRPSCAQSHNQLMLIARAPQNHKLNFKCKTSKTAAKQQRPFFF